MYVDAASIKKKTKEEKRKINEKYGIRRAYRTLHQCLSRYTPMSL